MRPNAFATSHEDVHAWHSPDRQRLDRAFAESIACARKEYTVNRNDHEEDLQVESEEFCVLRLVGK